MGASTDTKTEKGSSSTSLAPLDEMDELAQPKTKVPTGDIPRRERTPSEVPYPDLCQLSITREEAALVAVVNHKFHATIGANP